MGTTVHPDAERLHVYDAQVRRMVADPDMRGTTLAVGLAFAWACREDGPDGVTMRRVADIAKLDSANHSTRTITIEGFGVRTAERTDPLYFLRRAVAADAPVYRVPEFYQPYDSSYCEARMIRRPGLCGQRHTTYVRERDWDDGTETIHWFCTRHKDTADKLERMVRERDDRLRAERGEPPRPAANHGGLLARHLPGYNWDRVYAWARPGWTPPEQVPASYTTPVPTLQLIDGGAGGEAERAVGEPPALVVLHGMPGRLGGGRAPRKPRPAS